MKDKVLVNIYVPKLEKKYEMFLPISKKIGSIEKLLVKSINELSGGHFTDRDVIMYNKNTGEKYSSNITIKESNIRNGSEVILI